MSKPKPSHEQRRDKVLEGLDSINPPRPTVSEDDFQKIYLPAIMSDDGSGVSRWVNEVTGGNPFREVEVIKDGKILFVVPGVMRQIDASSVKKPQSVNDILTTSKLHAQNHPALGENYLIRNLSALVPHPPVDQEKMNQWDAILRRYGYETPTVPNAENEAPVTPPDGSRLDGIEFEDF